MKLSRDELKGIVKECLVEILSEGLVGTKQQLDESRRYDSSPAQPKAQSIQNMRSSVADKISFLPRNNQNTPTQQPRVDRQAIREASSDPMIQAMLADTALRGTPIMEDNRRGAESMIAVQGDVAAKAMLKSDPIDIFSESASKWATLAFSDKKLGA